MAEQQVSTNRFSVANWIVDTEGLSEGATHTTITGAIASASASDTIYVRTGTYTEDFTIDKSLRFMTGQARGNNSSSVTIVGTVTQTATATATFNGFSFSTNAATIISVSGTNALQLHFFNCNFSLSNGDCLTMDNANGVLSFTTCQFNQGADSLDIYNITDCAGVSFRNCVSFNGSADGVSTVASGRVTLEYCTFQLQTFTTSGSGNMVITFCEMSNGNNTVPLTTAGTGISFVNNSVFASGTAAAISIGTGTTVNILGLTVDSTNAAPITGAGTVNYAPIMFQDTGNSIDTTTQVEGTAQLGKYRALGQPAFNAFQGTTDNNVTGNGGFYVLGDTDNGTTLTEQFDQGGDFTPGESGGAFFAAPITGKYQLNYFILMNGFDGTRSPLIAITTSNRTYFYGDAPDVNSGNFPMSLSVIADMDAGDTADFSLLVGGGSDIIGVFGSASQPRTVVSGFLAC